MHVARGAGFLCYNHHERRWFCQAQETPPKIWVARLVSTSGAAFRGSCDFFRNQSWEAALLGCSRAREPSPPPLPSCTRTINARNRPPPVAGVSFWRAKRVSSGICQRGRPGLKNGGDQRDQENNYENKEENAGYSRCSRGNSSKSKHPGDQCNHSKNERPIKHFGLLCFSSPSDDGLASANARLPSLVAALMKQFMVSRNERSQRGGPCQ
jgi:hypothetical protein